MAESAAPENPYAHLPEPVRLEDTITSADVSEVPATVDEARAEIDWLLRTGGGGG